MTYLLPAAAFLSFALAVSNLVQGENRSRVIAFGLACWVAATLLKF